ncbi:hypothetical protein WA026_018580 [Henosepilachna vigintioctopunctata]|uniref:Uncharacterized protein n=1 Tax=Henosepilachna vigintioctopunctata TaxID=420089 RepID=A0AAW1UC19_9CUCU
MPYLYFIGKKHWKLDEYITISISVASIFDDYRNFGYNSIHKYCSFCQRFHYNVVLSDNCPKRYAFQRSVGTWQECSSLLTQTHLQREDKELHRPRSHHLAPRRVADIRWNYEAISVKNENLKEINSILHVCSI